MTRTRLLWAGLGIGAGMLVLVGVIVASLVPSDEELTRRTAEELEVALGVKVSVGAVRWRLLPLPAVVIENAVTVQPQPVVIKKLTVYPQLGALWRRSIKINRAELDGAVVPQLSLRGLGRQGTTAAASPGTFIAAELPLARFEFRDVTWITRRGIPVIYDGEADFDSGWRPDRAQLRRPGVQPATDLTLTRQGQQDRWAVAIHVGGGSADGEVELQTLTNGRLRLAGKLQPSEVEVASALSAFNRRPVISGRASGNTILSAEGASALDLAQTLHTRTSFSMKPAKLLRFDLDKAVRTVGKDHSGQTALDSVTGQLDTQNTPTGMVVNFGDIKARSGALSASGKATLANRHIDAELAVDLVDGVVGVPLRISGPTDNVNVSLPAGAVVGAVVGTAVLPGVGTALGARLGAALGKMFGSGPQGKDGAAPARPAR